MAVPSSSMAAQGSFLAHPRGQPQSSSFAMPQRDLGCSPASPVIRASAGAAGRASPDASGFSCVLVQVAGRTATPRTRHRRRCGRAGVRAERMPEQIPDFLPASLAKPRAKPQIGPAFELTGEAAIELQLSALQNNDAPYADHGVEVMYRFAAFDPFERSRYFGPRLDLGQFERFRRLFHHSTYRVLLCHTEHEILSSVYLSETRLRQRVHVLGLRPGDDEVFEFTLVQREGGSWDGYWFTESLIHDGEGVSRGIAY